MPGTGAALGGDHGRGLLSARTDEPIGSSSQLSEQLVPHREQEGARADATRVPPQLEDPPRILLNVRRADGFDEPYPGVQVLLYTECHGNTTVHCTEAEIRRATVQYCTVQYFM